MSDGYDIHARRKGREWTVAAFRTAGEHLRTALRVSLHGGIEEARKAIKEDVALRPVGLASASPSERAAGLDHPGRRPA